MGQARNRPPRSSECRRALVGWRGLHASTPHLSLTNSLPLSRNELTLLSPDGAGARPSPRNSRKTRPRTSHQARSRLAVKSCAAMQISKCWSSPPALSSCSAFLHLSMMWWHRRYQAPISRRTFPPVATHALLGTLISFSDQLKTLFLERVHKIEVWSH
jgi:hypothetical protein